MDNGKVVLLSGSSTPSPTMRNSTPAAPSHHTMTSVGLSLTSRNIDRASGALTRRHGETEVLVNVARADGLLIVSSTTEGCVGSFRADHDAAVVELVGDDRWDRADEVEVVLGGQVVPWARRYLAPVTWGQRIVEQFAMSSPPLPGR